MINTNHEELNEIIKKFAESGWDLIAEPSKSWLEGNKDKDRLINAVKQANKECGSCGCEYDSLYKRLLQII